MIENKIITYNNVLNPLDRTILASGEYKNIDEILKELKYDNEIYDLVISKNSVIQSEFFELENGDVVNIAIVPKGGGGGRGGKKILGIVASIAIAIAAPYAAAGILGTVIGGTGAMAAGLGTYALAAGIAVAGNLLLSAIMPKPSMPGFDRMDFKNSNTYGWNKPTNQAMQAQVVPKVFGTHKITPPLIASHIISDGDKQYFNGLYALNDGEIKDIREIKINDEPIENFKGVTYEIRNGLNNQNIISNFNDTSYDKNIGKKLNPDLSYSLAQTDGNFVTSLSVTLVFPRGLYYANDKGGLDGYSVNVRVEYSADGKNWTAITGQTISAAQTSTFRRVFRVGNLPPNKYNIRAKFETAPNTGSRYASDCYLEYVTETVSDDFIYPKTALLAIRALATDQLNGGAPRISAVVTANSDNPSHICRKILEDSGVESLRIMPSFNEWANFCEEKSLKCNIVFDSELSVRKALDTVSLLGRASVLQAGSKFDVIIEKAGLIPAQSFLFGMGNILSDTFKQNFLPLVDRANFIEITYYDKNKDYEPSVVSVGQIAADNSRVSNKSSVTLVGCTDEAQARAYGRFTLNCNRYLTETIEFEADKDSLVCRYGDIIKVSHDTPQYGFSGRLLEDSGVDFVILDRDLDTVGGVKYAIQIKNDVNEIKEFEILEILAPNKLRLNLNGSVFRKYDNYAFGEINKASKLYRILKIATSGEFTRHITAIEYNEDIYDDRENISVTDYSSLGVRNLRISEYLKYDTAKNIKTMLALAWSGNSLFYFVTYKSASEERTIKVFNSAFEFEAKDGETYKITVKDGVGNSTSKTYNVLGKLYPPGPVENLKAAELMDDWALSWSYDDSPLDFKEFHIYKDGVFLETTQALNFVTPITGISVIYDIYAVDTSGVKSAVSSVTAIAAGLENVNSVNTFYENDALNIVWGEINSLDRKIGYEIRRGEVWDNSQLIAVTSDTSARIFNSGTYQIAAFYVTNGGAKIMSAMPTTFIVDEANTLEKNVIFKSVEHETWIGAKKGTANSGGELTLDGLGLFDDTLNVDNTPSFDAPFGFTSRGIYDSANVCTLDAPASCKITSSLKYSGLNILNDFDTAPSVDDLINFDGFKNEDISAIEQIALSIDGANFGEYKIFRSGVSYLAKAFKMRLVLSSKNIFSSPTVSEYSYEIDVPDKFESGSAQSAANGVINIAYKTYFSTAPKVQITILNAVAGDDAILSNQTKGGFMIKIIDKNGIAVVRGFNYFVKGY
jgi:bacteriophage lambda tail assembly protein I|nr:MAG TPA: tail protein [Caudoviricetes sp.]